MINKIKVLKNRELFLQTNKLGITTEHNAEILQFEFPDKLNGILVESCTKKVKLTNEDGTLEAQIMHTEDGTSDTVKIDSSWTTRPKGILWVEVDTPTSAKDKMHWISYPYPVEFRTKPVEGDNPNADNASVDELRETLTLAMGDRILSEYHGSEIFPNFSESTYEQLLQFILNLRGNVAKAVGYLNGTDDVNEETYIGDSLGQLYDFTPNMIESLKLSLVDKYCKANDITLDRREQWLLIAELDEAYQYGEIKSIDSLALWSAPLYVRTADKARADLTQYMAEDINRAFNEEILSESATFDDNIGAIADKVNNAILTISSTMYDESSENLTYTEAIDRIEEVRDDYNNALNVAIGTTFPTMLETVKSMGDNAFAMQSIVDFVEAQTSFSQYTRFFNYGSADHLIKLPYMKTDKMLIDFDQNVHPTYIEELGFDVTSATKFSYGIFGGCVNTKKLILTGMDKRNKETVTNGSLSELFKYLTGLNELYVDYICPVNISSKSMTRMFWGLNHLQKIEGYGTATGQIDFTDCTVTGDVRNGNAMFYGCIALREVRFAPNTLTVDLDLSPCASLSKESAISAINACGTVSSATLKLSIVNPYIQITDPDIASAVAIATAKGWTVSYA